MNPMTTSRFSWKTFMLLGVLSVLIGTTLRIDLSSIPITPTIPDKSFQPQSSTVNNTVDVDILLNPQNPSYTVTQPGAAFISLHFQPLDLPDGDYVTLTDSAGIVQYTYPGDESMAGDGPGFWVLVIFGDSVKLDLHTKQQNDSVQVQIDKYIFGYSKDHPELESFQLENHIFGTNDMQRVACYSLSHPTHYTKSQAVVWLFRASDGTTCTAWRIGPDRHLLTAEHCLTSSTEMAGTSIYFNYRKTNCAGNFYATFSTITPSNLSFIQDNPTTDYALFQVVDTDSIDGWGHLYLDLNPPTSGEDIYIPQQPDPGEKMMGIEDSENTSGNCEVDYPTYNSTEIGYTCDTNLGSSGAPVIAANTHKVIAMHTGFTATPWFANTAIKMDEIWSEIDDEIRSDTVESIMSPADGGTSSDSTPTYIWEDPTMAEGIRLYVTHETEGIIFNGWLVRSVHCAGGICAYTPEDVHPNGEITVKFQTRTDAGDSDWSEDFTYTMQAIPNIPTASEPSGNEMWIRPTFTWSDEVSTDEYRLFISHAAVGTVGNWWMSTYPDCDGTDCNWLSEVHLRTGNHTWWVKGRNVYGSSDWSTPGTFKIWNTTPPAGSVVKDYPTDGTIYGFTDIQLIWEENQRASWYKVFMTDSVGKLYNQYHRASEICQGEYCTLDHEVFEPLLHAPRGLSELPTGTWIHWNVMPVNVAGNGDWTGYTRFWIIP